MANKEKWRNRIVGHGEQPAISFMANPLNWRIHPKAQREALTGVLSEVGWVQSVIVNRTTGNVVDGHARIEEALKLGDETPVPFIEVELSEEEEKQVLLTLDPISAMAVADKQNLDALLQDVSTASSAVAEMLTELAENNGLEYGATIGGELEDVEPQVDRAEELRQKWGVESGQIWQLGEHRLMCGDSTKAEDVERLMNGAKAVSVLTDPPYGQNQPGVPNDEPEKLNSILKGVISTLPVKNAIVVAFASPRTFVTWLDEIRAAGHKFERMLWLYKAAQMAHPWRGWIMTSESVLISTVGNPMWHEEKPYAHDCYYKSEVSAKTSGYSGDGWHGSIKPLDVISDIMKRICGENQIVYEPFSGSGTTLIAAEQLNRKCYAMEIAPAYVAVALERWSQATGKTPELVA